MHGLEGRRIGSNALELLQDGIALFFRAIHSEVNKGQVLEDRGGFREAFFALLENVTSLFGRCLDLDHVIRFLLEEQARELNVLLGLGLASLHPFAERGHPQAGKLLVLGSFAAPLGETIQQVRSGAAPHLTLSVVPDLFKLVAAEVKLGHLAQASGNVEPMDIVGGESVGELAKKLAGIFKIPGLKQAESQMAPSLLVALGSLRFALQFRNRLLLVGF
ncbi:MAG: hypothetical protein ACLPHP_04065 [Candidatus Sulfotelmatobacter sp.]